MPQQEGETWAEPGQHTGRCRGHGDRGESSIQMAIVFPFVIVLTVAVVQAAMWFHARNVALTAAREGVAAARTYQSPESAGAARARDARPHRGGQPARAHGQHHRQYSHGCAGDRHRQRSLDGAGPVGAIRVAVSVSSPRTVDRPMTATTPTTGGGWRAKLREDRGSESIATAIVAPLLLMLLCTAIAGGRIVTSGAKIDAAAEDAARAASISRTHAGAQAEAAQAAARSLDDQGIRCASASTSIDTSGLAVPLGQVGTVTVTISCTVPLSDLLLPGVPGSKTMTSTFTSVVDAYRSREG